MAELRILTGAHPGILYYPRLSKAWRWMFVIRLAPWAYRKRWGITSWLGPNGWSKSLGLGYFGFSFHVQKGSKDGC